MAPEQRASLAALTRLRRELAVDRDALMRQVEQAVALRPRLATGPLRSAPMQR